MREKYSIGKIVTTLIIYKLNDEKTPAESRCENWIQLQFTDA